MVGVDPHSPSARHSRFPTTVLAARHQRRSSGGAGGAGAAAAGNVTSSQDEGVAGPGDGTKAAAAGGGGAAAAGGEGGDVPAPPRLGVAVPAVAVSAQAGQAAEEVTLFFGIIDFLQVGEVEPAVGQGDRRRWSAAVAACSKFHAAGSLRRAPLLCQLRW
jgi:hypothetical protein